MKRIRRIAATAPAERRRWRLLGLLLVVELALFVAIPQAPEERAPLGYVLKDGRTYTVAWKAPDGRFHLNQFQELREALHFANAELSLYPAHLFPAPARAPLERVWVSDLTGSFQLLWKAANNPFLFKWTFDQERDAQYFAGAFEAGAYTQSPFGHSMLLIPKEHN